MMDFVNLPSPYADFCVINIQKNISQNTQAMLDQKLLVISEKLNVNLRIFNHFDKSSSRAFYFNDSNVDEDNNRFSLVSGLAISNKKLLLPPNNYMLTDYENLDEDFGQFTSLMIHDVGVDYKTDSFGAGHIYYYESQDLGFSIVSNRAHFIKIILDELSIRVTLNQALVKGTFFSNFHFFTQQSFLSNELIEEIKLLRLDERLSQRSGSVVIEKNKNIIEMLDCSKGDYASLLNEFCEKAIDNLQTVFNSKSFSQHILDLSGGKDSRLCLALLLNTGYSDKISILTNDVPKSDDLAISAGITNLLSLSYIKQWNSKLKPCSIDEGFNLWRSYFFGNYHRMGFAAWSPCGKNIEDVRISGASGGIYRSTWSTSSFFQKGLNKYSALKDVLKYVVTTAAVEGRYTDLDLEEVIEALYDEFKLLPGKSVADKIDNHYLFHRNRSHFGLRGFSFYNECLTLTPLLSRNLFKASRLLSYNDRQSYKVFYDLYNKLAPFLLNIRFDRDDNPFGGLDLDRSSAENSVKFHLDESISKWLKSQAELNLDKQNSYEGRAQMRWSDYLPTLKKESLIIRNEIEKYYPDLLPRDINRRINDTSITNREMSTLYSQLSSVVDNI